MRRIDLKNSIYVESSSSLKDVSFSEEILDKQISAVFSDVLEKMFNDPATKKKLEDASKMNR